MFNKAEVFNKTNTSNTLIIDELDKSRDNIFNHLTFDEKFSNIIQVASLVNEKVIFKKVSDNTKIKIYSNLP